MLTLNTALDPIPCADWADLQHSHENRFEISAVR